MDIKGLFYKYAGQNKNDSIIISAAANPIFRESNLRIRAAAFQRRVIRKERRNSAFDSDRSYSYWLLHKRIMKKLIFPLILIFLIFIFVPPSFAFEETIIYEEPFVVRKLQGCIRPEGGIWPADFSNNYVFFRIYGPDGKDEVRHIKFDDNDCFNLKIPQGQYKFTIEVEGWDDAKGTIIVTPKAKKNSRILIVLGLS